MILTASGTGDMGSMAFGLFVDGTQDTNNEARFSIPNVPYRTLRLLGHFAGAVGLADLRINLNSRHGRKFDTVLSTVLQRGVGADVNWRVRKDQEDDWIFQPGDTIVVTWTNPDPGNITWGLEWWLGEVVPDVSP